MTGPQELAGVRHLMSQGGDMPNDRSVNQQMTAEKLREAFEAFVRTGPGFRPSMLYRRDMAGSERFGEYCDRGIEWQWRALQAGYALREADSAVLAAADAAEGGEAVAWLVLDKQGALMHAAAWREAAHEHINDAINEHGLTEAAKWVVRPAYTHPAPAAPAVPEGTRKLIEQCHAALAEELGAWDIDPPLHHVKEAHDACVAWLAAAPQAAAPAGKEGDL